MSRLYPGHDRRKRRFGAACIFALLGSFMTYAVQLWPGASPVPERLPWLLPLLNLGGIALLLTSIVLTLAVLRELKRLEASNRQDD